MANGLVRSSLVLSGMKVDKKLDSENRFRFPLIWLLFSFSGCSGIIFCMQLIAVACATSRSWTLIPWMDTRWCWMDVGPIRPSSLDLGWSERGPRVQRPAPRWNNSIHGILGQCKTYCLSYWQWGRVELRYCIVQYDAATMVTADFPMNDVRTIWTRVNSTGPTGWIIKDSKRMS